MQNVKKIANNLSIAFIILGSICHVISCSLIKWNWKVYDQKHKEMGGEFLEFIWGNFLKKFILPLTSQTKHIKKNKKSINKNKFSMPKKQKRASKKINFNREV